MSIRFQGISCGLPALALLAACSNCETHTIKTSRSHLITSDYTLTTQISSRYRECPRFLNEPTTTDYPSRSEYFLTGPKGKRDITPFFAERIQDNTGFFTIDETPYFIKDRILYKWNLDPLRTDSLYPFPFSPYKYDMHVFGDSGFAVVLNNFNENIDYPLDRFLGVGDTSGFHPHHISDSLFYGGPDGNRRISISEFFGYDYFLCHDVYYWEGRYYGIFQDNEKEFVILIKDPAASRTETMRVPFPPTRSKVPNILYRTQGYFAFYDRANGSFGSDKYFGKVDPIRMTVDWKQGKFIHLSHGAVTFSSSPEPYATF